MDLGILSVFFLEMLKTYRDDHLPQMEINIFSDTKQMVKGMDISKQVKTKTKLVHKPQDCIHLNKEQNLIRSTYKKKIWQFALKYSNFFFCWSIVSKPFRLDI